MQVLSIQTHNALKNVNYLLVDQDQKKALCIDPWDGKQIYEVLQREGLDLVAIINTHEHWDHIRGNDQLVQMTGAEVWAHENLKAQLGAGHGLASGEEWNFGKSKIRVLDTPGHTESHICLLIEDEEGKEYLISGDTLFNAGVGNCKNGGDPHCLYQTFQNEISKLSDDVLIYPGHDYMKNNLEFTLSLDPNNQKARALLQECQDRKEMMIVNMETEREVNLFLNLEKTRKEGLLEELNQDSTEEEVFLALRARRDRW